MTVKSGAYAVPFLETTFLPVSANTGMFSYVRLKTDLSTPAILAFWYVPILLRPGLFHTFIFIISYLEEDRRLFIDWFIYSLIILLFTIV